MREENAPAEPPPRCRAEIDLGALRGNAALCRRLAGAGCAMMAVVKADAYGHGLEGVVGALSGVVEWFGVANLREARRVRAAAGGRERGVLVLSAAAPDEVATLVADGFSASVSSMEEVEVWAGAAKGLGTRVGLHAVVDTGMGRMGCQPGEFLALVERIRRDPACRLEGMASHFPSADEDESFTRAQIARFGELVAEARPDPDCLVHLGNSAGLLGFQGEIPYATLARPGLALYGVSPLPGVGGGLRPAMRLVARVTLVREIPAGSSVSYGRTFVAERPMRVATISAGYGDGYPRHLSGAGAEILVGGRRCPVLGRVTMDQVVIDVSALDQVSPGEDAVLLGRQGEEAIGASELAEKAGTIPWEIFTGITSRVVRVYRDAADAS
jgi:alanine racemase